MPVVATRRQWPVGKGGFSTGSIRVGGRCFEYVYDCGADKQDHLKRCLDFYAPNDDRIDILYISHLDKDHVNGITELTSRFQVDVAVLPYLSPLQKVMLLAAALLDGTYTEEYAKVIVNPGRWLSEQRVRTLVHVAPRNNDEPIPDEGQSQENADFDENVRLNDENESDYSVQLNGRARVQTFDGVRQIYALDDVDIQIQSGQTGLWLLIPFVRPFEAGKLNKFRMAVTALEAKSETDLMDPNELLSFLGEEENRSDLKGAYNALHSDHNEISLCLLSKPAHWWWRRDRFRFRPFDEGAWIHTGDICLNTKLVLDAFMDRYEGYMGPDLWLQLPHHGSCHSITSEALYRMSPDVAFAAVPHRSKDHPHKSVKDWVALSGADLHLVKSGCSTILIDQIVGR